MRASAHRLFVLVFLAFIGGVPIFQAAFEKLVRHESPTVLELFRRRPSGANLRAFEKELDDGSLLGERLRHGFQLARWLALRELGEKALVGRDGWTFYTPEISYLAGPYFRDLRPDPALGDPVLAVVDLRRQLRARGVELLVIPVPSKPSIYPDRLSAWLAPGLPLAANTQRLERELAGRGVKVLGLHQAFLEERQTHPARSLYMKTDTHWTGEGALLAAERIAAWVRSQSWYRRPAVPRYRRQALRVERRGDIPRMTRIPLEDRLFPLETVNCYQVRSLRDGAPYEDDPASPILLLGDSFARVFQTDEPEAAGLIANLAFELQLPLASIVNDGGASTLVRQELARDPEQLRGKRLVIWLFAERDVRFGLQGWQLIQL